MKKLFISQPMNGLTDKEILETRTQILMDVVEKYKEPFQLIDSFIDETPKNKNVPLAYLGQSILFLSDADVAYFGKGWQDARGCCIEYDCAIKYGVETIVSEFDAHKTAIGRRLDAGLFD